VPPGTNYISAKVVGRLAIKVFAVSSLVLKRTTGCPRNLLQNRSELENFSCVTPLCAHGSISTSHNLRSRRRCAAVSACLAARTLSKTGQERSPFQKMDNVFRAVIALLKAEIHRCEDSATVFARMLKEYLTSRF
jgi:hypothetical protein